MRTLEFWGLASLLVLLSGCQNFFEGGVIFGGPTVIAERRDFNYEYDDQTKIHTYTYTLRAYALPGSAAGRVVFLDKDGNPLDELIIPESCPPKGKKDNEKKDNEDNKSGYTPCGPYDKPVTIKSRSQLTPKLAVKYRSVSNNGQSKVLDLQVPFDLYVNELP